MLFIFHIITPPSFLNIYILYVLYTISYIYYIQLLEDYLDEDDLKVALGACVCNSDKGLNAYPDLYPYYDNCMCDSGFYLSKNDDEGTYAENPDCGFKWQCKACDHRSADADGRQFEAAGKTSPSIIPLVAFSTPLFILLQLLLLLLYYLFCNCCYYY